MAMEDLFEEVVVDISLADEQIMRVGLTRCTLRVTDVQGWLRTSLVAVFMSNVWCNVRSRKLYSSHLCQVKATRAHAIRVL
jgi:hypothetical protein